MKKLDVNLIPLLNVGAEKQQVILDISIQEKALFGLVYETLMLSGTKGVEDLEKAFRKIAEQLKKQSILDLEDDGTIVCKIWEDRKCCNDNYWYAVEHGFKHDVPCYLCAFYSEDEINEIRDRNRIKMFLEGSWTYYPCRP